MARCNKAKVVKRKTSETTTQSNRIVKVKQKAERQRSVETSAKTSERRNIVLLLLFLFFFSCFLIDVLWKKYGCCCYYYYCTLMLLLSFTYKSGLFSSFCLLFAKSRRINLLRRQTHQLAYLLLEYCFSDMVRWLCVRKIYKTA